MSENESAFAGAKGMVPRVWNQDRRIRNFSLKDESHIENLLRAWKNDVQRLIGLIILIHVNAIIAHLFGWSVLWYWVSRFWVGLGYFLYHFSINVYNDPMGIILLFILIAFLYYIGTNESMASFSGFRNTLDKDGNKLGSMLPGNFTGTYQVEDEIRVTIITPYRKESLKHWLYRMIPYYISNDQLKANKHVIISAPGCLEPKENAHIEHNHLKEEIVDAGLYFIRGSSIYKVFTCGEFQFEEEDVDVA